MSDATFALQMQLLAAGFNPGPLDGDFGAKTLRAVCAMAVSSDSAMAQEAADALWVALQRFEITTPLRIINFVANCGVESRWALVEENLNYSPDRLTKVWPNRFPNIASTMGFANNPRQLANVVYGGRMGNRPNTSDGWDFRGRSWPQLTGRDAYEQVGKITGQDLATDPGLVMSYPGAALAAAGFWTWKNLSPLADAGRSQDLRIRWNGGTNGLTAVLAAVDRLKFAWGIP